jgi:oxygen-independent coproporphyrinogen-3 oxidase
VYHISSYALTVEPKTAMSKMIQTGKMEAPKDDVAQEHFMILLDTLESNGLSIMNCQFWQTKLFKK